MSPSIVPPIGATALGPDRAPDPIFYCAGGPGEGASTTIDWVQDLKELRRRREIVLVDQRGTGKSNPLRCDFYGNPVDLQRAAGDLYPPEGVERCRAELEKVANLTLYTTAIGMDDIDQVRAALGYDASTCSASAGPHGFGAAPGWGTNGRTVMRSAKRAKSPTL